MPRVLLACLLLLSACTQKDPEGTLKFHAPSDFDTEAPGIWIPELYRGDNPLMRLPPGNLVFVVDSPVGISPDPNCFIKINLVRRGDNKSQTIYNGPIPNLEKVGFNNENTGLYLFNLDLSDSSCKPAIFVTKAPWPNRQ